MHLRSLDPDGLLQGGVGRGGLQDAGGGVQGGGEKTGAVNWAIDTFIKRFFKNDFIILKDFRQNFDDS